MACMAKIITKKHSNVTLKCLGGQMASMPDFGSQGMGFESCWKQNSTLDFAALLCTEPFSIILQSSSYDLNNFERDLKLQLSLLTS